MEATVFNIQRFSLHDGPGIRTVVFLKGCPLRCLWCHNPESTSTQPQIMYNPERCIGCGGCATVCACHKTENGLHIYDRTNCTNCGKCTKECFSRSLTLVGQTMTTDEVMQTVLLDKKTYEASGGGLTISGGEPLMHWQFTKSLLQAAKAQGIHTCIETSGFGANIAELVPWTDLFLFDYKATGNALHQALCGVPQTPILENLQVLQDMGARVILRCPLIPDKNANEDHLAGIAKTVRDFPCIEEIQLEPYHRLGISKADQLGTTCAYEGQPPEKQWTETFASKLRSLIHNQIPVVIN